MAGGIVLLWEKWGIQGLVILSFALQVILHHMVILTIWWRVLLWLAYQMADYTAIYALGHMSISSRSPHDKMAAFWAPFLLLHLGGPDTITAYALEDNKLWLRHLLILVGQVAGAAYVLYLYITTATNSRLQLAAAAILMFLCGLVKYGERTWALKSGNLYNRYYIFGINKSAPGLEEENVDTEEILLGAYYLDVDFGLNQICWYDYAQMKLSIYYDKLYTKAMVIHTWYGCCIRIVSPLCVVAAFLLFQFSNKDAYRRVDVTITYVLFVGALILEVLASIRVAGSSWACVSLRTRGWRRLFNSVMWLRRNIKAGNRRRTGMDSLGQLNMIELWSTTETIDMTGRIASAMGLYDWWIMLRYSTAVSISQELKAFVLEEIWNKPSEEVLRNSKGRWTLERMRIDWDLQWTIEIIDLDHTILMWHIATDLYLASRSDDIQGGSDHDRDMKNTIRTLSNYMMFLLVAHPDLLPSVVDHDNYKETFHQLTALWPDCSNEDERMNTNAAFRVNRIVESELAPNSHRMTHDDDGLPPGHDAVEDGLRLAAMLLRNQWKDIPADGDAEEDELRIHNIPMSDMLKAIAGVWVELLCFAAHRCARESHFRKLSSGSEFITIVWEISKRRDEYMSVHGGDQV